LIPDHFVQEGRVAKSDVKARCMQEFSCSEEEFELLWAECDTRKEGFLARLPWFTLVSKLRTAHPKEFPSMGAKQVKKKAEPKLAATTSAPSSAAASSASSPTSATSASSDQQLDGSESAPLKSANSDYRRWVSFKPYPFALPTAPEYEAKNLLIPTGHMLLHVHLGSCGESFEWRFIPVKTFSFQIPFGANASVLFDALKARNAPAFVPAQPLNRAPLDLEKSLLENHLEDDDTLRFWLQDRAPSANQKVDVPSVKTHV